MRLSGCMCLEIYPSYFRIADLTAKSASGRCNNYRLKSIASEKVWLRGLDKRLEDRLSRPLIHFSASAQYYCAVTISSRT